MPSQSADRAVGAEAVAWRETLRVDLVRELYAASHAEECGLDLEDAGAILLAVGQAQRYGQPEEVRVSGQQQVAFFQSLKLADLMLARACAWGKDRAWERFLAIYREPLNHTTL